MNCSDSGLLSVCIYTVARDQKNVKLLMLNFHNLKDKL